MNRIVLSALATLLFVAAGLFWWQGRAETEQGDPPPAPEEFAEPGNAPEALPSANVAGKFGPAPPEATEATREQRRFWRYDRDRDGRITRNEMLSTRTAAFRKIDKDGNRELTPAEFATTKPKRSPQPKCRC